MKSREHYNEAMQTLREKEVKDENIKRLKIWDLLQQRW
jgi:hypothetical protein